MSAPQEKVGFAPYHAVRADFLARAGRRSEARQAYATVLALDPPPAEERWLRRKLEMLENEIMSP